jgi:hypothetical protein
MKCMIASGKVFLPETTRVQPHGFPGLRLHVL